MKDFQRLEEQESAIETAEFAEDLGADLARLEAGLTALQGIAVGASGCGNVPADRLELVEALADMMADRAGQMRARLEARAADLARFLPGGSAPCPTCGRPRLRAEPRTPPA